MRKMSAEDFLDKIEKESIEEITMIIDEGKKNLVAIPFETYLEMIKVIDHKEYLAIKKAQKENLL